MYNTVGIRELTGRIVTIYGANERLNVFYNEKIITNEILQLATVAALAFVTRSAVGLTYLVLRVL